EVGGGGTGPAPRRRDGARDRADGERGQAGGESAGGWLDGGDARRRVVGAFRAYGGGDGGRAMDSDRKGSAGRPAPGFGPTLSPAQGRGAPVTGTVTEMLPHAMYRVRLEQGGLVLAHIA